MFHIITWPAVFALTISHDLHHRAPVILGGYVQAIDV